MNTRLLRTVHTCALSHAPVAVGLHAGHTVVAAPGASAVAGVGCASATTSDVALWRVQGDTEQVRATVNVES